MRARYPAAVAPVLPVWYERAPGDPDNRTHLFDFADGLRLIVSRGVYPRFTLPGDPLWVAFHLSASFGRDSPTWAEVGRAYEAFGYAGARGRMKDHVLARFRELDPDRWGRLEFVGWFGASDVPHWVIWEAPHVPA